MLGNFFRRKRQILTAKSDLILHAPADDLFIGVLEDDTNFPAEGADVFPGVGFAVHQYIARHGAGYGARDNA